MHNLNRQLISLKRSNKSFNCLNLEPASKMTIKDPRVNPVMTKAKDLGKVLMLKLPSGTKAQV